MSLRRDELLHLEDAGGGRMPRKPGTTPSVTFFSVRRRSRQYIYIYRLDSTLRELGGTGGPTRAKCTKPRGQGGAVGRPGGAGEAPCGRPTSSGLPRRRWSGLWRFWGSWLGRPGGLARPRRGRPFSATGGTRGRTARAFRWTRTTRRASGRRGPAWAHSGSCWSATPPGESRATRDLWAVLLFPAPPQAPAGFLPGRGLTAVQLARPGAPTASISVNRTTWWPERLTRGTAGKGRPPGC